MATSGTTAFDLNIDEVIDEGYERCGLSTNSGYDLRSARRSLNLLFAEWGNRGIHLWKVNLNEITLVNGTNEYTTASNVNVDVTGNSNTFTLNHATTALASTLDLDWIISGDSNTITSGINADAATNYVNIDGNDNALTHAASGYAGNYFYLDHDGSNRTFNITQSSTLDNDWLKILSSGTTTSTVCVVQNDQGTSTGC